MLLCFDVSCQALRSRLAGMRNWQIGRKNIYLGIIMNISREMLQFQLDMSARQKVNIFIGQRSNLQVGCKTESRAKLLSAH